jgi:thioredoxin-like negative regulator of GroEL
MKIEELTANTFQKRVVNLDNDPAMWDYLGDKPCIIMFYTPWCSLCMSLIKQLEELNKAYNEELYLYKVNIEVEKRIATNLNVRTVPTLFYCPLDQEPQTVVGLVSKEKIVEMINDVLLE